MRVVGGIFDVQRTARAVLAYFWARKLWWIVPMLSVFVLFVILIIIASLAGNSSFNYTLF